MFKNGTLKEKYELSLQIRKKTKKVAKILGFIYLALIGLLTTVAVFASVSSSGEQLNVGMLVLAFAGFPVGYFAGHIMGSSISWAYYWFEIKFNKESPIILAILLWSYVGIWVWLKYRCYHKKLAREMKRTGVS